MQPDAVSRAGVDDHRRYEGRADVGRIPVAIMIDVRTAPTRPQRNRNVTPVVRHRRYLRRLNVERDLGVESPRILSVDRNGKEKSKRERYAEGAPVQHDGLLARTLQAPSWRLYRGGRI
jgi:hypothetical protein